jgi:hypothetical protein
MGRRVIMRILVIAIAIVAAIALVVDLLETASNGLRTD